MGNLPHRWDKPTIYGLEACRKYSSQPQGRAGKPTFISALRIGESLDFIPKNDTEDDLETPIVCVVDVSDAEKYIRPI
jgi:hypothetical protein